MVRILRNQNVNHTEGVAQRHNPPRSWEIWLLLCGRDPRIFPHLGAGLAHPTRGMGTRRGNSCIREGWAWVTMSSV